MQNRITDVPKTGEPTKEKQYYSHARASSAPAHKGQSEEGGGRWEDRREGRRSPAGYAPRGKRGRRGRRGDKVSKSLDGLTHLEVSTHALSPLMPLRPLVPLVPL